MHYSVGLVDQKKLQTKLIVSSLKYI